MRKYLVVHSTFALILIVTQLVSAQIEVNKCAKYKKDIFEKVTTFSAFIHGAEEIKITSDNCKQYAPYIAGGTPAQPKEFPHVARLGSAVEGREIKWLCGGTLISEKFVLTAAHCLYTADDINVVRIGELDFSVESDDAKPEDFKVKNSIEHPDYKPNSNYDDIALIELDGIVKIDSYKHPACLPTNDGDEFEKIIAIGWGSIRFGGPDSKKLLKVSLARFNYSTCREIIDADGNEQLTRGIDNKSQMCAGSSEAEDTCPGDSGGPLLAYHTRYPCLYSLLGVTSFGIGCANPGIPGVYTRVYNYIDWIRDIVWK